jgi:hypothetical protein
MIVSMSDRPIRAFDARALYSALDIRRGELGLSWKGVADQIWDLSSELNELRKDHPISPSTITNMAKNPRIGCHHALFMLRWLGRSPEEFLQGDVAHEELAMLPSAGPERRLRWELARLYAAMDERRRAEGMAWQAVAAAVGTTPSQLTGLRTAKFGTGMDVAMRIVQWLGRSAADFVGVARW